MQRVRSRCKFTAERYACIKLLPMRSKHVTSLIWPSSVEQTSNLLVGWSNFHIFITPSPPPVIVYVTPSTTVRRNARTGKGWVYGCSSDRYGVKEKKSNVSSATSMWTYLVRMTASMISESFRTFLQSWMQSVLKERIIEYDVIDDYRLNVMQSCCVSITFTILLDAFYHLYCKSRKVCRIEHIHNAHRDASSISG